MKKFKKVLCLMLALVMIVGLVPITTQAAKIKLNRKSVTISPGNTTWVYVTGTTKSVKWASSNKKVALVKNGAIKGVSEGKCTITAKVAGKKLTCKVTVRYTTDEKLGVINNWLIGDLWNECYVNLRDYAENGTDCYGRKMDVDETIKTLKKVYKDMDGYNKFITGLKGSEYDKVKKAWTKLKEESDLLYQKAITIDWSTIKFEEEYDYEEEHEKLFDTEYFVDLRDKFTDAMNEVTF